MDPTFTWFSIGEKTTQGSCCSRITGENRTHVIDIMGALTQPVNKFKKWLKSNHRGNTVISLGGELKEQGEGAPPSNFRAKDVELNTNVVHNLMSLIIASKVSNAGDKQSLIFVNTIPRNKRLISFNITDEGVINTTVDKKFAWYGYEYVTDTLTEFLEGFGINGPELMKIRESCKGARYNTYLIDMISFLYQTKNIIGEREDTFEEEYRLPVVYTDGEKKEIYMNKVTDDETGYKFMVPKDESVEKIYIDFVEAISNNDNPIKHAIRRYVNTHYVQRWTDFDVNDTDDAFTILMILYAYRCKEERLTKGEDRIVKSIEEQIEFWFEQL